MVDTRGRVAGSEREGRKEGWEGRRGAVCVSTSYVCITKRDSIRLDQQPSPAPASPSTYPRNYVIFSKRLQLPPPSIRFLPCKYKYIPQAAPGNTYLSSRLVSSTPNKVPLVSATPSLLASPCPTRRPPRSAGLVQMLLLWACARARTSPTERTGFSVRGIFALADQGCECEGEGDGDGEGGAWCGEGKCTSYM